MHINFIYIFLGSKMFTKILITLLFMFSLLQNSEGQFRGYCIADEQVPEAALVAAMQWACRHRGDCAAIQENGECYLPYTLKDHASYAFNSYFQNMRTKGASCYFNAAAILVDLDPSHGSCKFQHP